MQKGYSHEYMSKRSAPNGFAPIIILVGLVILLIILLTPLPYYENSERCTLTEPSTKCISKGWHLGASVYHRLFAEKPQSSTISSTQITSPQPSLSPTVVTTSKPTVAPVSNGEIIAFNPNPAWPTYTDTKAKFTVQYGPQGKISSSEEGKEVTFLACTTDPKLTNGRDELCLQGFSIRIFDDYNGGSRREWLINKNPSINSYDLSFEEVVVSGVNSLMVFADDPASMSFAYVLMPKNNKMYELFYRGGKKSGDLLKTQILSTFKFTQ